jgi:hypothetical protein
MCTSAGMIRVSGGFTLFPRIVKNAFAAMIMLHDMTFGRVAALAGLALGVMAANVAVSILYMVVYSYVIDPGHDKAYYDAHVQIAAPYCAIVAGIPLMFLVGWWVGLRPALVVWLVYAVINLAVLAASGPTWKAGALVAASILTQLGSVYVGALAAGWRA